jgi:GR25 family glycosyltransferase involved in LPS biosynthesis
MLSHIKLWNQLANITEPVLILEDDAIINDDLNKLVIPDDFDLVFIGHCYETMGQRINQFVYQSVKPICLHGYLVSPKGIKKLIKATQNTTRIEEPIDNYLAALIQQNYLISYSIHPEFISQKEVPSQININHSRSLYGTARKFKNLILAFYNNKIPGLATLPLRTH